MKIEVSDSFFESIKRLNWQNTFIYKLWELFRYDLPRFFRNVWDFRKALWRFQWWDDAYPLEMLQTSLKIMAPKFESIGKEVEISRSKKVVKMKRAIHLIQNFLDDNFIEQAEEELGKLIMKGFEFEPSPDRPDCYIMVDNETEEEKEHNRKIFDRARNLEEDQWIELFQILKGPDYRVYPSKGLDIPQEEKDKLDEDWFDGSGLRSWWD
jgi:hypothetical protein